MAGMSGMAGMAGSAGSAGSDGLAGVVQTLRTTLVGAETVAAADIRRARPVNGRGTRWVPVLAASHAQLPA